MVVDCRLPTAQVEELLFGRTSAPGVPPRASALLQADRGSLLLRSLELLPRSLAERLGRFVSRKVAPAPQGGEEQVDVRVLVTASAPVTKLIAKGVLDPELARALTGMELEAVAVRDRKPDVLQLLEHFAQERSRAAQKASPTLSPDARRLVLDYQWPGNVSEVRGVAERLSLLYAGLEVSALQLPLEIQEGQGLEKPTLAQRIARLERDAISEALREARGKKIRAAALLGISRPTLDKKIEEFHLVVEKRRA